MLSGGDGEFGNKKQNTICVLGDASKTRKFIKLHWGGRRSPWHGPTWRNSLCHSRASSLPNFAMSNVCSWFQELESWCSCKHTSFTFKMGVLNPIVSPATSIWTSSFARVLPATYFWTCVWPITAAHSDTDFWAIRGLLSIVRGPRLQERLPLVTRQRFPRCRPPRRCSPPEWWGIAAQNTGRGQRPHPSPTTSALASSARLSGASKLQDALPCNTTRPKSGLGVVSRRKRALSARIWVFPPRIMPRKAMHRCWGGGPPFCGARQDQDSQHRPPR